MPIYEYQCESCGVLTDIKHGFKETPNEPCPACAGTALKRLFHAAGIVFKGSGFYKTDSRKSSALTETANGAKNESAAPKAEAKGDTASGGGETASAKGDVPSGKGEAASGKGEGASGKGERASGTSDAAPGKGDAKNKSGGKGDAAA